jgi:hypothetical protein
MIRLKNKLSVIVSLAIFLLWPMSFASAANNLIPAESYVIKLLRPETVNQLKYFGNNITPRFSFSNASEFQNVYTFSSALPLETLQDQLQGKYVYLEPERQMQAQAAVTNDPGFTTNPDDVDKQWGLVKTGFPDAWSKTTGSKNVIVAVIDTGIDETHEDLQTINFVQGFNVLTRQLISPGTNSDDGGHGTLITGVLGATPNNGVGIVGTNWQISIMPIKVLDAAGKGEASAVSEAIVWAADHGADVINLSLSGIGFGHDTTLSNAISYAFKKDAVIVAAAGNDIAASGDNLDAVPVYPICDDNNANMIIGVAATDHNDLKASFSGYGKNCIDVSAPGKRILSTINHDPLTKNSAPNSYAYASGTSLAVPFVSGQAALLKALYPSATNTQIRDRIVSTTDQIDNLNLSQCDNLSCRGMLGSGRINVEKSLEAGTFITAIMEGDLVKSEDTSAIYHIVGGQKRIVSPFVYNQKYLGATVKSVGEPMLVSLPQGSYETPTDGTLVKLDQSPTVFYMNNGMKLPITAQIFSQRGLDFKNVNIVSYSELNSWPQGNFLPPTEGALVKTLGKKTVYWVVSGTFHPINSNFYWEKGLNIFPIMVISEKDLTSFAKGEAYIK